MLRIGLKSMRAPMAVPDLVSEDASGVKIYSIRYPPTEITNESIGGGDLSLREEICGMSAPQQADN